VSAGIIDSAKLQNLDNECYPMLQVRTEDGKRLLFFANITNITPFTSLGTGICSITSFGGIELKPKGYPTTEWKNITRTYLVLIRNGSCTALGKMNLTLTPEPGS
ncbi:MAG: hypothetical protein ACP5KK_03225, partial [Candidatus Nanoarchaeia archaeon]